MHPAAQVALVVGITGCLGLLIWRRGFGSVKLTAGPVTVDLKAVERTAREARDHAATAAKEAAAANAAVNNVGPDEPRILDRVRFLERAVAAIAEHLGAELPPPPTKESHP